LLEGRQEDQNQTAPEMLSCCGGSDCTSIFWLVLVENENEIANCYPVGLV
jgi:hypothetical protein